jgi:phospholipid/cholesterol/gamma-HCH transport system ATP-binding protein
VRPALALTDVAVVLDGVVVVQRASAAFVAGRRYAVVGRSGAGKSVLMKAACGLLPIAAGRVDVATTRAAWSFGPGEDFAPARGALVFVHQDPALMDDLSVDENVRFAVVRKRDVSRAEAAARVDRWLTALGLADVRWKMPRELSPGVLRKVALCRALCLAPDVLVVDEPTTGLDPEAAAAVDDALADLHEATGATLVVVTHAPRSLARLQPEVLLVAGRTVRALGTAPALAHLDAFVDLLQDARA